MEAQNSPGAEIPQVPSPESIKSLKKTDVSRLTLSLSERIKNPPTKSEDEVREEKDILLDEIKRRGEIEVLGEGDEQKAVVRIKGHHNVELNGRDHLWNIVNIFYPKKEAEVIYKIVRTAQLQVDGEDRAQGLDAQTIHKVMLNSPQRLGELNSKQMLGDGGLLKLFQEEINYKKSQSKGLNRRRLLQAAAVVGATAIIGGGIREIVGRTSSSPQATKEIKSNQESQNNTNPERTQKLENTDLFTEIIKPFIEESRRKRAQKEKEDPEYYQRVDKELNNSRINLVVFGYSEEHNETYQQYGGAPTIISYDMKTNQIGVIHLSRDIRAPELERLFPNDPMETQRVRSIYQKGGFDLMGKVCEDITGLASDFQIVMKDVVFRDAIDQLADGKLTVTIPKDHYTSSYRLNGVAYGDGFIHQGTQEMDTAGLMKYIFAEDKNPGGKEDERSYRKNDVLEVLSQKVGKKTKKDPLFMFAILNFAKKQIDSKNIEADFDTDLLNRGWQFLGGLAGALGKALSTGKIESKPPEINKHQQHVFHDPYFGDGGVTRTHNIKNTPGLERDNPVVIEEAQHEKLPGWMLIPVNGNPKAANLVKDYWQTPRRLVKEALSRN